MGRERLNDTASKAIVLHMQCDKIVVGDRRRKDYGDIDALASNIAARGLLHPIVIDSDDEGQRHLIAGGRRLEAVKRLGWERVPARLLGELTETERREIELEENTHRKDLTRDERLHVFEQAKQVLRDRAVIEAVKPIMEGGFTDKIISKPQGGRPSKPDSDEKAAELAGIPLPTIRLDRQHAAAEVRYPVLRTVPTQSDALKIAAKLDAMPEPVRTETIAKLERHDPDTEAALSDRPPVPKGPTPHEQANNDLGVKWERAMHDIYVQMNSIRDKGGIAKMARKWSRTNQQAYLAEIRRVAGVFAEWEEYLAGEVERGEDVA